MLLPCGLAQVGGLAGDPPFDIVKLPDPVERLPRDLGLRGLPDIVEVAPQMCPAGRLAELAAAVRAALVELAEARIGIRLKDASAALEVLPGVLGPQAVPVAARA